MSAKRCAWAACRRVPSSWPLGSRQDNGVQLDGHWLCGLSCFEESLRKRLGGLAPKKQTYRYSGLRPSLGLILVNQGNVSAEELRGALEAQKEGLEGSAGSTGRIGEVLRRRGSVGEDEVTAALSRQFGIPRVSVRAEIPLEAIRLVPAVIARSFRAIPLEFRNTERKLLLAVVGPPNYPFLSGLGRMLDVNVTTLFANESEIDTLITRFYPPELANDRVFSASSPEAGSLTAQITSLTRRYGAKAVRVERCGPCVWVRLLRDARRRDLVFELIEPTPAPEPFPEGSYFPQTSHRGMR